MTAFEKKYPGIKVRSVRANATETAVKILNESKAGRVQSDVFAGTNTVHTGGAHASYLLLPLLPS